MTRVFISYSWDSPAHKAWVKHLAVSLDEHEGIHVIWDGFDVDPTVDLDLFMEHSSTEADLILVVSTPDYVAKANARKGGAGVETTLSARRHWSEREGGDNSSILAVLRDGDSLPNYIGNKLYVDFRDDSRFTHSLDELKSALLGNFRVQRPVKRPQKEATEAVFEFTRAEQLMKAAYRVCSPIIDKKRGTDFSAGRRVSFELWEVRTPRVDHVLFVYPNANVSQTIARLAEMLQQHPPRNRIEHLVVLHPKRVTPGRLSAELSSAGQIFEVSEMTYDAFIWAYIHETGAAPEPRKPALYIAQQIIYHTEDGEQERSDSASDRIMASLADPREAGCLVVAAGGMGKTSLCSQIAHLSVDADRDCVFIDAESLRDSVGSGLPQPSIRSLYDLYSWHRWQTGATNLHSLQSFELSVLCGRLTVIVDGIDELAGVIGPGFDISSFFQSISTLHRELGEARILVSMRPDASIEQRRQEYHLEFFELEGFDRTDCRSFLRSKLYAKAGTAKDAEMALKDVDAIISLSPNGRVAPFYVELIANLAEDRIVSKDERSNLGLELANRRDSELENGFRSNHDLHDMIVTAVLKRELVRQSIPATLSELARTICEAAAEHGRSISTRQWGETLDIMYGDRGESLLRAAKKNPLLRDRGDSIEFSHDFVHDYFMGLYLINEIFDGVPDRTFARLLGSSALGQTSTPRKHLVRYLEQAVQGEAADHVARYVRAYRDEALSSAPNSPEKRTYQRAISTLLSILDQLVRGSSEKFSDEVRRIFEVEGSTLPKKITGLFLTGDLPAVDLSNMQVWHAEFVDYRGLHGSTLINTHFFYTKINGATAEIDVARASGIQFDQTCDVPESLRVQLLRKEGDVIAWRQTVEGEMKRFLRSFYKNAKFVDAKRMYIAFSKQVPGLFERQLPKMIAKGILCVSVKKSDETYYEVTSVWRESVRSLFVNNTMDARLKAWKKELSNS